jgi:dTDP-4-dehydrorhamnose 3,5-epimerase-like enzyme
MGIPEIFEGGKYSDERGTLIFNNNFNASEIKRMYCIENRDTKFIRGWTGHKIEQRWFSALKGSFVISLIKIDNWDYPLKSLNVLKFNIDSDNLNILYVPGGYASAIQAKKENSKLLVMADYSLEEIQDDFRFPIDYFENL